MLCVFKNTILESNIQRMLYRALKILIQFGIKLFYKEVKIVNAVHLDHNGPVILIANHPNTLMDAWMLGLASKRPIYFMAKATFFNTKFKRWLLSRLNMIPVNRAVDGKIKGVSNQDSFEACYQLLEQGGVLAIFPEGTSFQERKLRELKSGAARIAIEAERRNEGLLNLRVIPVGLFYSDAEKFRSQVQIEIGKPIEINKFLSQENAVKQLTYQFKLALESVIPTPAFDENEKEVESLVNLMWARRYFQFRKVNSKAQMYEEMQRKIDEISLTKPYEWKRLMQQVSALQWKLKKLNLPEAILRKSLYYKVVRDKIIFNSLIQILLLPITVIGFIVHFIPYKLTDFILVYKVKDIEYHAPLGVLLGFILYPLTYWGIIEIVQIFIKLPFVYLLIYWLIMPIIGLFTYSMFKKAKLLIYQLRWYTLLRTHKTMMLSIFKEMEDISVKLEI